MSCDFQPPSRTFGPAPPPFRLFLATTHLSLVAKSPVVHPLSVQLLTKCSSRNSFVLKTIHLSWVGCTPGVYPLLKVCTVQVCKGFGVPPIYPLSFHILA